MEEGLFASLGVRDLCFDIVVWLVLGMMGVWY